MSHIDIEVARYAGVCYGVERALGMAEKAADEARKPVNTLGPLIHNPLVVNDLESIGVGTASSVSEVEEGTLIIRAHGVVPSVVEDARTRGLDVLDATCPYVKKVHNAAERLVREGYQLIVVGESGHPEVEDAIDKMLSPMNVSLHAITPECRRKLIGRNAPRGIEVLERFLEAGIEIHAQIVLCPGINDGDELLATLEYVEAHPGITSLAIVPLGFTKHQKRFTTSYSDDVEASRAVVKMLEPFQQRAREERGCTVFQLADEFYIDAHLPVPPAGTYDGFPQFYDGIGMLRSFLDEVESVKAARSLEVSRVSERLGESSRRVLIISGEAAQGTFGAFCNMFDADAIDVFAIKNEYFGGNVNVTGLICACDLLGQLPADLSDIELLIPDVMFNYDGLTLDGLARDEVTAELEQRGAIVHYATPAPNYLLDALV